MMNTTKISAAAALVGVVLMAGCETENVYVPPPPPEVTVARPVTDEVSDYLEFTGATRSIDKVDIRARVNGYLQSIEFEDGATIEQGDLLFVIEPEPFEVALASAQASLQKAQAALRLANATAERTIPLVRRGALPEQELDVKEADRATAEADVAAAKAAIRQAELDLSYTRILAPISGRIGQHMVDVGNLVQAESTLLATIENYDPIYAIFNVSESAVLRLLDLQRANGAANQRDALVLMMALGDDQDYRYTGVLDFADLGVDPGTGTQLRRGVFPNPDHKLLPGLFARLRLPIGAPEQKLLVTERAIATDQRGEYVLVVDENNDVVYRPVKLGITVEGMRVVQDGVGPDDWIIVNGLQRARPGAKVAPQRAEQMTARTTLEPTHQTAARTGAGG